jgi:hypothetical protein
VGALILLLYSGTRDLPYFISCFRIFSCIAESVGVGHFCVPILRLQYPSLNGNIHSKGNKSYFLKIFKRIIQEIIQVCVLYLHLNAYCIYILNGFGKQDSACVNFVGKLTRKFVNVNAFSPVPEMHLGNGDVDSCAKALDNFLNHFSLSCGNRINFGIETESHGKALALASAWVSLAEGRSQCTLVVLGNVLFHVLA